MTLDTGHGRAWASLGGFIVLGVIVAWFLNLAPFFGPPLWLGVTGMAVGEILNALDRIHSDMIAIRRHEAFGTTTSANQPSRH